MFFSSTKATKDVIFTNQASWASWFNNTKSSVGNFWRYFDPEGTDIFLELVKPVKLLLKLPLLIDQIVFAGFSTCSTFALALGETLAMQTSCKARNEMYKDGFYKDFNMYNQQLQK